MHTYFRNGLPSWFYTKSLYNKIKEDKIKQDNPEINITYDHADMSRMISIVVEPDFDLDAFKASLAGVKAGDYSKPLKEYSKVELLDHLIERTLPNG